ncbi:CGNR zinc finger domain-containing protein [Saccharopolyspora taberi]|uniref:CGNR zinc finger domain-containing protein n=1 Tax=Saccharopolyspora taberi TaxID=60895 RepID=A0ABN3V4X2_9PSEU
MKLLFNDYVSGAGMATDLVNTSPVVRSAGEVLTDPAALTRFLAEHGIESEAVPADLDEVLALRGKVRDLLEADEDRAAAGANALIANATPVLHRDGEGDWQWYVTTSPGASLADQLGVLIGVGLLGVLRALSHDRFRHCASPVCEGMFVDTSKAGRRRYCMPELCGNRVNVARHRARQRES